MNNYFNTHNELYFAKVRPEAKIPTKDLENAGYDLYCCFEEDFRVIPPHTTVLIPTGIATACHSDYCLILKERGSTGTKGMGQRSGIIDSGYRGEIFCPVSNLNSYPIVIAKEGVTSFEEMYSNGKALIYPYNKAITQILAVPVPRMEENEISFEELKNIPSKRGVGALGSSGK